MPQPDADNVKLYAVMTLAGFRKGKTFEVEAENYAAMKALEQGAIGFTTFSAVPLRVNGGEAPGEPIGGYSDARYVGIEKVYSRQEVIDILSHPEKDEQLRGKFNRASGATIKVYKAAPKNAMYVRGLEGPDSFRLLEPGDVVYDKKAKQVYPKEDPGVTSTEPKKNWDSFPLPWKKDFWRR